MFLSMPPNTMPWNGEMDRKTQLLLDPQTYQVIGMRAASTGTDPVRPIAGKGRTVPWPPEGHDHRVDGLGAGHYGQRPWPPLNAG